MTFIVAFEEMKKGKLRHLTNYLDKENGYFDFIQQNKDKKVFVIEEQYKCILH